MSIEKGLMQKAVRNRFKLAMFPGFMSPGISGQTRGVRHSVKRLLKSPMTSIRRRVEIPNLAWLIVCVRVVAREDVISSSVLLQLTPCSVFRHTTLFTIQSSNLQLHCIMVDPDVSHLNRHGKAHLPGYLHEPGGYLFVPDYLDAHLA